MSAVYEEIGVKGDDCFVGMFIDVREQFGFDIGVDEELSIGISCGEGVELLELCIGAVEVIVDGDTDDFIDSLFHRDSLYMFTLLGIGFGDSDRG